MLSPVGCVRVCTDSSVAGCIFDGLSLRDGIYSRRVTGIPFFQLGLFQFLTLKWTYVFSGCEFPYRKQPFAVIRWFRSYAVLLSGVPVAVLSKTRLAFALLSGFCFPFAPVALQSACIRRAAEDQALFWAVAVVVVNITVTVAVASVVVGSRATRDPTTAPF